MPSVFAHYHFGDQALPGLHSQHQVCIRAHRSSYDLGLQGPDPLYYDSRCRQTGSLLHTQTMARQVARLREIWDKEGHGAFQAYAYGYVFHFLFDSLAHPYVGKLAGDTGYRHVAMETAYDRWLLKKAGHDPLRFRMERLIAFDQESSGAASRFWQVLAPDLPREAYVKACKLFPRIRGILVTPNRLYTGLLIGLLKALRVYKMVGSLLIRPRPEAVERSYQGTEEAMHRIFEEGIQKAAGMLEAFDAGLRGLALPDLFGKDFAGRAPVR